ncbi:MAG TPA: RNA polymerase sigma-70 factor [Bacteroidales bacterium]|nr:RNA polymerase sigma-70 factor [Bacteroidales bacterium]
MVFSINLVNQKKTKEPAQGHLRELIFRLPTDLLQYKITNCYHRGINLIFVKLTDLTLKDLLLIEELGRRDKVVFDYIFNYYYSSLCVFSMQYLNDRNAVEDLVQDFFVSLWIEAPNLQIRSSLKSYLFAGVKNRCLDYQKHQKVIEKYREYILFSAENGDNTTELYFAESELRQAIQKCSEKLPPRCREIFELSRHDGLSNQEISQQLGISKRTVELQISNSLKILRRGIIEYLPLWLVAWLITG